MIGNLDMYEINQEREKLIQIALNARANQRCRDSDNSMSDSFLIGKYASQAYAYNSDGDRSHSRSFLDKGPDDGDNMSSIAEANEAIEISENDDNSLTNMPKKQHRKSKKKYPSQLG